MSDTLIITFQSQLSIVMETILKSAMFEITKLVEDSFVEEVGHAKQEVELLMRRLQFYESKLKERERRVRCVDCGKATANDERTTEPPAELLSGADTLCFSLSLREQSGKRPPLSEVRRSAESLDSCAPTETHTLTQKKANTLEPSGKQDTTVQIPQHVLQKFLPSAAVTGIHEEHCASSKPRESHPKTPGIDFTPSKEIDLTQSRLTQSSAEEDEGGERASSPPCPAVKSEHEPDPVPIKEEEEMLPVWDCTDDSGPGESHQNHRDIGGSWNREETQLPQKAPLNPPAELVKVHPMSRQRTFSVVAREILTQFQVWQRACYSRNIEWGPITAKDAFLERNAFPVAQRYLVQLQRGDIIQHMNL
uniref:Si:ch73-109d9.1 n=1 Tax=Pygocentrus nattereri TaxID=42514 RepID=A0AAR2KW64_PYGNA